MHDDGILGGPLRQVKVDNWGIFFLQRLQQFFNRSDHCDLTLQFTGSVKIKVHRLVLNACTEYFQALEKKIGRNKENCLQMPSDLSHEVVLPIINFMYTGRLEFRDTLTKKLYYTAGRLNMPVLTKLLDAQGASELATESSTPTVALTSKSPSSASKHSQSIYGSAKKVVSKELPETLPGRKLPIWKKRRTPFLMSSFDDPGPAESAAMAPEHASSTKEEPARPTRFEWPEDEDALKSYVPPFDSITYESAPLQPHTTKLVTVTEKKSTFEELQSRYQPIKRQSTPVAESTPKKSKMMDIQSVKEYLQEQEVRKQIVSSEEDADECLGEGGMALGDVDDDDDDDEREADSMLPEHEDMETEESQETAASAPHHAQTKSILKQRVAEEVTPGSKKVRFSLAANQEQSFSKLEELSTDGGEGSSEMQSSPANHAKIISEVLKKYPHLVRDNKNIRLRIMKQGSCPSPETDAKNKKVSYVVLKAGEGGKNRNPAKVIVKTGGRVEHISSLVPPTQTVKPISGAENTTGPWLCFSCGTNEDPINFESYYLYRRHLQDVHMEKIDARICEHCGHRASKRNLLLYHLYTKHNIPPPRNCQFPKCDQCEYVALSESLLIKHRNNHSNAKDFVCKVCNASFKSNGALQGHMQTNLHSDPDRKKYTCPYCQKLFVRNINLKAHIRSFHKDVDRKFEEEEQQDDGVAVTEVAASVFDPKKKRRRDILLLRSKDSSQSDGQHAVSNSAQAPSLEPSSEAEALSNVASGIAASLGLADQLTEVHEHQTVVQTIPGADGTVQTFIISAVPGGQGEYIVPEMIAGGAGGEQYQIATASSLGELVHYDASNLSSVVSSLAGVGGQQTIVITTAPSGGQEHLKLISADGSTLDQVTLLTGQNLLVTNPDGTTSTASATEGYQAILQPNGVLTLQPVGTHVLQGEVHDGETITEETLVHQGYVTQGGSILTLTQSENLKDMEQTITVMPSEDEETKPYTIISHVERHVEEEVAQLHQENVTLEEQLQPQQETLTLEEHLQPEQETLTLEEQLQPEQETLTLDEQLQPEQETLTLDEQLPPEQETLTLEEHLSEQEPAPLTQQITENEDHIDDENETSDLPMESHIIEESVPLQTEDMKSDLVSGTDVATEIQQEPLTDENRMMQSEDQFEISEMEEMQVEESVMEPQLQQQDQREEMVVGSQVDPNQLIMTEEQGEMHEGADIVMAAAAAAAAEKTAEPECSSLDTATSQAVETEEMTMEMHQVQCHTGEPEEILEEVDVQQNDPELQGIKAQSQQHEIACPEDETVEGNLQSSDEILVEKGAREVEDDSLQDSSLDKENEFQTTSVDNMHEEVDMQETEHNEQQSIDTISEERDAPMLVESETQEQMLIEAEDTQATLEEDVATQQPDMHVVEDTEQVKCPEEEQPEAVIEHATLIASETEEQVIADGQVADATHELESETK